MTLCTQKFLVKALIKFCTSSKVFAKITMSFMHINFMLSTFQMITSSMPSYFTKSSSICLGFNNALKNRVSEHAQLCLAPIVLANVFENFHLPYTVYSLSTYLRKCHYILQIREIATMYIFHILEVAIMFF